MKKSLPSYQLITDLIGEVEKFESSKPSTAISIESFAIWLNQQHLTTKPGRAKTPKSLKKELLKKGDDSEFQTAPVNVQLTLLLNMLSKHFKLYSKKVLHDSDLVSMDGHIFLASLYHSESLRKMELIRMHYMEIPSGIEVIKRLLKKGFIEEFDDVDDGRAKRIKITKKGRKEFEATIPDMRKVIEVMSGDLSNQQKVNLVGLLDELNDYHNSRHEGAKKKSLDALLNADG